MILVVKINSTAFLYSSKWKIKISTASYQLDVEKKKVWLRVTNSKLKNKSFHFELLLRKLEKTKSLFRIISHSRFHCWNEILPNWMEYTIHEIHDFTKTQEPIFFMDYLFQLLPCNCHIWSVSDFYLRN